MILGLIAVYKSFSFADTFFKVNTIKPKAMIFNNFPIYILE